tara:strand:- start:291 stop:665 length:375 start_codon:yes stop_codon:yes gene_type:complete
MLLSPEERGQFGRQLDVMYSEMKGQLSPEEYTKITDEMIEAPLLAYDLTSALQKVAEEGNHSVRTVLLALAIVQLELSDSGDRNDDQMTAFLATNTEIAVVLRGTFQEFMKSDPTVKRVKRGDE